MLVDLESVKKDNQVVSLFTALGSAGVKAASKHVVEIDLGSISPTYLRTAFTPVAPNSIRINLSCQYLFTLLGSTGAKSASRALMKLTPDLIPF
jgi:hypothetical protein